MNYSKNKNKDNNYISPVLVVLTCMFVIVAVMPRHKDPKIISQCVVNATPIEEAVTDTMTIETATEEQNVTVVTDEEYRLLVRVCMSEAGGRYGEPFEGKVAVIETVLNRCELYGKSIKEVITEVNQYSLADNGEPDETVFEAVDYVLNNPRMFPEDMIYFRANHYHSFGTPYKKIGNHYFSTKENKND